MVAVPVVAEETTDSDPEMTKDRGYFFGYSFGAILQKTGNIDVDIKLLIEGLTDALSGTPHKMDDAKREVVVREIKKREEENIAATKAARDMLSQKNLEAAEVFLAKNKNKQGVTTTASGLQYEVIIPSEGSKPGTASTVSVHYTGKFIGGVTFDSSVSRGAPSTFNLNGVIAGWIEGLQLMSVGAKYRFYIHPELGYGERGRTSIPPNSLLIFDVELLEIK